MAKLEKEIKVLDIVVEDIEQKLQKIGATFKGEKNQKIYTYDIPTLYYRYLELVELLKAENALLFNTSLTRLKTLLVELEDLLPDDKIEHICHKYGIDNLLDIVKLPKNRLRLILNDEFMEKIFKENLINPNKWLRLRQSNDKIELTLKHVFNKKTSQIQNVFEMEIGVSSFSETNLLLESMGLARRNYQEKIRKSYIYKTAEIEIDIWPKLNPYMEIECDDNEIILELLELLELSEYRIVSLNTAQLYKELGIDIQNISELKFDKSAKS